MNKYVRVALDAARQAIRETPRQYFAPLVAIFRWFVR